MSFLESIVFPYLISFIVSYLQSAEGKINWAVLEAEADAKVHSMFGSPWLVGLQAIALVVAHDLIAAVKAVISPDLVSTILSDCAAGNFVGAVAALEAALKPHYVSTAQKV